MHRALPLLIAALNLLSGMLYGQKTEPNQAIAKAQESLIGRWLFLEGEGLPEADTKGERIWSFDRDHNLTDNKEDKGMKYFLVQNAGGEIWMLMLYSLGDEGPMVMRVEVEGDTLKLNYVGETREGTYGTIPDRGLTFKRREGSEQDGALQPATRPASEAE
jgi:hypothetical protein